MNIYKYIRSKDVREYNEKIGHKFTATESAFLVWLNYEITLKEKHDAWREIMRDMKDEEVPKRVNADYAPSLFALLNKFINTDNRLIDEFYKKDERTVYSYRYICKGDSSFGEDFGRIYSVGYIQGELRKKSEVKIMKFTSAEAGKLLKKLNYEQSSIILREENGKEFLAAIGEDLESVRPDYNFGETQKALDAVNMNQTSEIDL
mgnify:CR=1 FL=1